LGSGSHGKLFLSGISEHGNGQAYKSKRQIGERVSLTQSLLGFGRGQVPPVSIDIFMSTELLVLRDQRFFRLSS